MAVAEAVLEVGALPANPLEAAATFYQHVVPGIREDFRTMENRLVLAVVFEPADLTHRSWRLAAVQELAREGAPGRVNGVVGDDPKAIRQLTDWLSRQAGVTGQLLAVDGKPAENR